MALSLKGIKRRLTTEVALPLGRQHGEEVVFQAERRRNKYSSYVLREVTVFGEKEEIDKGGQFGA